MDPTTIVASLPYAPAWLEHVLAWLAITVTALALLGYALDKSLPALRRKALESVTTADDRVVVFLMNTAAVLTLFSCFVPRLRVGEADGVSLRRVLRRVRERRSTREEEMR
jgi:hypothetical protein